jgi:serine/threonine-protein kinase
MDNGLESEEEKRKPDEEEVKELRARYLKKSKKKGSDTDTEEEEEEEKKKRRGFILFLQYMAVLSGFIGFIALGIWITDSFIIPSYVHDKPTLEVPDLIGMEQSKAAELLSSIGLRWEKNGEQYDPDFNAGEVVLQTPEPGITVKAGRPIYITISQGQERAKVPYMVGLSSREAMVELVSRGLVMGNITYENSELFDPGIVLTQSVDNGRELSLGDTVSLVVSKGSEFTIYTPDLVGMDIEAAKQLIMENELLIGNITEQMDETFSEGTVLSQYPTSGSETLKGTYIDLIVTTQNNELIEQLQDLWDER